MVSPRRPHIIWWGRRGAFLQRIDIQYLQNRRRADPGDRGDACAVVGLGEGYFVLRRVGNCIFIIYVGRGGHSAIGYNYRMSNVCAGIGRGQMTVLDSHIAHHRHVQKLYEELLADVPGVQIHKQPEDGRFESNYWLCAATLDPSVRIVGQEDAYKEVIKTAVGGAAGVIHQVSSATTDCQPNENVEALRVFMLSKKVECRPVWKPMHKQPVYEGAAVYTNDVETSLFRIGFCLPAGPYVSDDDVRYIVECIREAIVG